VRSAGGGLQAHRFGRRQKLRMQGGKFGHCGSRCLPIVVYFQYNGNLKINVAIDSLSALAHEGRLAVFKMLVKAGPDGIAAGEIARKLDVPPNSLSANLNILGHAGLVVSRREGRSIIYSARYDQMSKLLSYLLEDCCNGAPEICLPLTKIINRATCCP